MGLPIGGGIGGLVLLLLFSALTGTNPADLINGGGTSDETVGTTGVPADDPQAEFVSVVLADTEATWTEIFRSRGESYEPPTLVLFTQATQSACGVGQSAMGPFYCPLDRKVYIDLDFYRVLRERFRAPGDFAQAYVIAHEIGHHVQTLLGVAEKVQARKQQYMRVGDEPRANALQVRMELQADCLAGVWANHTNQMKNRLEPGDIEKGLNAASAIGDDTLQRRSQGHVVPESFTHGSSAQRVRWFRKGLDGGQMAACDTFGAPDL
jgi:predicted metalloprotease